MKNNRIKLSILSLALVLGGVTSCGKTETSSSVDAGFSSSSVTDNGTMVQIVLSTANKEIEIGNEFTVKAKIGTTADNKTADFTVDDPTILKLPENSKGQGSIRVTALKIGTAVIKATAVANPFYTDTITINVIALKPTLREAFAGLGKLKNYTVFGHDFENDDIADALTITKITEKALTQTDKDGSAFFTNENGAVKKFRRIGEAISNDDGGKAVYLDKNESGNFVTEDAVLVKSSKGFLTSDNFLGFSEGAYTPNDSGYFFGFAGINPTWATNTKNADNTYEITGTTLDQDSSFIECMLWQLVDCKSYLSSITANNGIFSTVASNINTTVIVNGVNDITIQLTDNNENVYIGEITDVGTTAFSDDVNTAITSIVGAAPALTADMQAGRTAILANNYIQTNLNYPDHTTQLTYYSYVTEKYVFNYLDNEFVTKYNSLTTVGPLTKSSGGYYKGTDGIYKFEVTNPTSTSEASLKSYTKVEGTDASSSLTKVASYMSELKSISTDMIYSFSDETASNWDGDSNAYHSTSSVDVFWEFANYYAIEDYSDTDNYKFHFEKAQSGIAVKMNSDNTKAEEINFSVASYPFINDDGTDGTSWGVNRFSIGSFGNGKSTLAETLLSGKLA
ncbi:MAG: hypothetical protein WCS80_03720 [Bacilli bacterium]